MRLLPNLSSLTLNKRREEAVGTPFAPSTTPVNVTQVDWLQLFQTIQNSIENVEIVFLISTIPIPTSNKNLRLRFVANKYQNNATRFRVESEAEPSRPCIEFVVMPDATNLAGVKLDSLFYNLSDEGLATCQMQPKHRETRGAGSIAIEMIQAISVQMGQWMYLSDAAAPLSRSDGSDIPLWMRGASLTVTHSIARGAGYYQKRGFMPQNHVENVVLVYGEAAKVQPLAYFAGFYILQSVLLQWTELIFNTPINKLAEAIRTGFTPILQQIQARQSAAFPNIPKASQHPIFALFSQGNLKWHADYLEYDAVGADGLSPIEILKQIINEIADDTNNCPERVGAASYFDFSIRGLMRMATHENSIFQSTNNREATTFKNEVFDFANRAWKYVRGSEVYGTKLICPFMVHNGALGYMGVVESNIPGGVPVADFVTVDTNFAVQFEPVPQPQTPARPPQPPQFFVNDDPDAGGIEELE